jgi:flagellar protein FlgJ
VQGALAPVSSGKDAFVASLRDHPEVNAAAQRLGVPKEWLIAQAALETGWGKSAPGNNLFGIKAMGGYTGPSTSQSTREVYNGKDVRENARFRAYDSVGKSVSDYANLLSRSKRYTAALGAKTPEEFFGALQRGGYATDPNYARTAAQIARQLSS